MENKKNEHRAPSTEFMLNPENERIRIKFYEKNIVTELSSDYTLPDYLPEIRKMLGVSSKISPVSRFIGNGVEFSGRIDYDLIYCAADGTLASVPLGEDFSFSVQPDIPENIDWNSGGDAFADVSADMVHVRVTAPRKVNVKCRLLSLVRAYGYDESLAARNSAGMETLTSESEVASVFRTMSEVIELSDEISLGGSTENFRPIFNRGSVIINDANRNGNRLNCRGEVITETLIENKENGEIRSYSNKIPFTHEIELGENLRDSVHNAVKGSCGEITLSEGEGKYLIDTEIMLEIDSTVSCPVKITEDIFIPEKTCTVSYRDFKYEYPEKNGTEKINLTAEIPLSDLSISDGSEIIDRSAVIRTEGLTESNGISSINGTVKLWVLSKNGDEYSSGEASVPFSCDIGALPSKRNILYCKPSVNAVRCRIDGEKVICDIEAPIPYSIMVEETARIADSIQTDAEQCKKESGITVYYPEKGETLWNVAKKFASPLKTVAELNDLPFTGGQEDISAKKFIIIY